jgi:hypothetical protein
MSYNTVTGHYPLKWAFDMRLGVGYISAVTLVLLLLLGRHLKLP